MLNSLKNILKLLQLLILFVIPVIVVYWTIVQANLPTFIGIQAVLSLVLNPIILSLGSVYTYNFMFEGKSIDMTAFVAIGVLLLILFASHILIVVIEFIQAKIEEMKESQRINDEERVQEEVVKKYIDNLKDQKICYLMLGINKTKSNISYLLEDADEDESNSCFQEFINHSEHYQGKLVKNNDNKTFVFRFYNQEELFHYVFYLERNIKNLKSKMSRTGIDCSFKMAMDCAVTESKLNNISKVLDQILHVTNTNQLLCTSLFSEKYKKMGENSKIRFCSVGLYSIANSKYELFEIKKDL
jgi:hypothetical protein